MRKNSTGTAARSSGWTAKTVAQGSFWRLTESIRIGLFSISAGKGFKVVRMLGQDGAIIRLDGSGLEFIVPISLIQRSAR